MTDNPYSGTYPDLMAGKTVMYVHGFGSAASTNTVTLLRRLLPGANVVADDLPLSPVAAMEMLHGMCSTLHPDLVIGTSMGGLYAEMLHGYDRILVNPAFQMADTMHAHGMMGLQRYQNPRKDGVQEFIVTKALVKEYRDMTAHNFEALDDLERQRVWGLFGDEDPLVHTFDLFREHYPQAMHFHGEHRLTESVIHHAVIPLIRHIDDRQQQRERPVVYITVDAMSDSGRRPRPSMQKAYGLLLRHYDVHAVAAAPTNSPQAMTDDMQWVERHLSSPAWGKTVFCNDHRLLLGDYLVDTRGHDDFLGTTIVLGSDEFKTWDDIITFFSRLGGQ